LAHQEIRTLFLTLSNWDELRGGMNATWCKDYVLVMLFIKYVSNKSTR